VLGQDRSVLAGTLTCSTGVTLNPAGQVLSAATYPIPCTGLHAGNYTLGYRPSSPVAAAAGAADDESCADTDPSVCAIWLAWRSTASRCALTDDFSAPCWSVRRIPTHERLTPCGN
jgi:hypothetical protein